MGRPDSEIPYEGHAEEYGAMFTWIGEHGFKAEIGALRQEHPTMLTFTGWLRTLS
jgi:hypothetical protein